MSPVWRLLGAMMAVLQGSNVCDAVTVVETKEFSPEQFFFKIRADIGEGESLQVRIYFNGGHVDYAYQVFSDVPLRRWDNKEEFAHLATYPHHYHDAQGKVTTSPLRGDPIGDIAVVLRELLSAKQEQDEPREG